MVAIKTVIPDRGLCYVTLDDAKLNYADAILIGKEIGAAGKRAQVLNVMQIVLLEQGHPADVVQDIMRRAIKEMGQLN